MSQHFIAWGDSSMTYEIRAAVRRRSARRDQITQITTAGIVAAAIAAGLLAAYGLLPS